MFPLLAYLMDAEILDLLGIDDEVDRNEVIMFDSDEDEDDVETDEEDEDEEGDDYIYEDDEESNSEERAPQEAQESDDSDDEESSTAPKRRCTENLSQSNGAGTSHGNQAEDSRPSTSRQQSVDFRHSVQLQLAPQPTLYQQDERLEPQPITIQARSTLESTSDQPVSSQNMQREVVIIPPMYQLRRSDVLRSVVQQSALQEREATHSVSHRIHYLHLYPREE